jgi:hypothetical protein
MAAPTITSVTPTVDESDVVLGTQVIVVFSFLMDHSTINDGTFSLTGPGQTMIATPDQMIAADPQSVTGREYITGTFSFDDTVGGGLQTRVTFNPSKPLRPDVEYTVLIMGSGGALTADCVKNIYGVAMVGSYTWNFTTGELNLIVPPPMAPVPGAAPQLDPSKIIVIPRQSGNQRVGADLTQEIDLIFPDSVSLSPYDPTPDILISIEAILGDPDVVIPSGLIVTPVWASYGGKPNRKLTITISGWSS